jgi:hypothetical protein
MSGIVNEMKIYGYKNEEDSDIVEPAELAEITLVASPEELRKIARFITDAADGMEARGRKWGHEHLSDKYKEFKSSPHFVIYNPEAE